MLPNRFRTINVDSPCAKIMIQVCGNVPVGFGGLRDCVDLNWDRIAGGCGLQKRVAPEIIPAVCDKDALILCKHIVQGNDAVHSCLHEAAEAAPSSAIHSTAVADPRPNGEVHELSPDCHAALRLQSAGLDVICAPNLASLCPPHVASRDDILDCLHRHQER
jgi:hypothetical protein